MRSIDGRLIAGAVLSVSLAALLLGETTLDTLGRWGGAQTPSGPVCSYRLETGQPCMGCGGTHAFARAARGDFAAALRLNPLGAWVGLALWLTALGSALTALSGRRGPLVAVLLAVLTASPAAFVWNAVWWWTSLPALTAH